MIKQDGLSKLKQIQNESNAIFVKEETNLRNMARISESGSAVIEMINQQFETATKLNKQDVAFLFLAIALQCTRILFQPKLDLQFEKTPRENRHDAQQDGNIEKQERSKSANANAENNITSEKYPDIVSMYLLPVPYDAMAGTERIVIPGVSEKGKQLYGGNHHSATLGHDPVLGYIFGTINIMTRTISFKNPWLQTCNVILTDNTILDPKNYSGQEVGNKDYSPAEIVSMLRETISEDPKRIPAAVGRHVLHLQSDKYCKDGLPFPFLDPAQAQKLIDSDWNSHELQKLLKLIASNLVTVGTQALINSIINVIIEVLHKLTYREESGITRDVFAVKTHKILEISNVIATMSNVIAVAIGSIAGIATSNGKLVVQSVEQLDLGGLLVTIHRIVTDQDFINKIKMEYIKTNWQDYVEKELAK